MPIKPEDRARYPANWKAISLRIRFERAEGRCECDGRCGHEHPEGRCEARHGEPHPITQSIVVLTTMHLDHVPENCDDDNLMAGCQRCHLAYDREHHLTAAARTRAEKAAKQRQRKIATAERMRFQIECATGVRLPRIS